MDKENMLPVGTTLRDGTYKIEKQLSSGGFGNTYVVRNLIFDEIFAMKEFFMKGINLREEENVTVSVPDNKASFESQKGKFLKEAQRLRKLDNKHIVRVHDLFESNGTVYYIMDFIEGQTVAEYIKDTGKPIAEQQALNIFSQVLEVLDFVHHQTPPMLHLDIKPDNIMLDKQGNVFLLDFGSSKQIDSEDGVTTSSGFTMTKGYAPSELIDGNKDRIGPWTDFYELGATLYNMVTGKKPPTASEVSEDGRKAFSFSNTISIKIQDLIVWLMSHNRSQRPHDAKEVLQRICSHNFRNQNEQDYDSTIIVATNSNNIIDEEYTEYSNQQKLDSDASNYEDLSVWQRIIKAWNQRSIIGNIVLLLGFFVTILALIVSVGLSTTSDGDMKLLISCLSLPLFLMLLLGLGKKWAYWGLSVWAVIFALLLLRVCDVHSILFVIYCAFALLSLVILFLTLRIKKNSISHWEVMDKTMVDTSSILVVVVGVLVFVGIYFYGNVNTYVNVTYSVEEKGGLYGLVDSRGNVVIDYKYKWLNIPYEGLMQAETEDGFGYVKIDGEPLRIYIDGGEWPAFCFSSVQAFSEGLGCCYLSESFASQKYGYGCGYIDTSGNMVIPFEYEDGSGFYQGASMVKKNGLWGFINRNNEVIIPFDKKFDKRVSFNGVNGFIDENDGHYYTYNSNGELIQLN